MLHLKKDIMIRYSLLNWMLELDITILGTQSFYGYELPPFFPPYTIIIVPTNGIQWYDDGYISKLEN